MFYLGTDEEDTCYAKLLLASREEVLKEVILFLLLTFMDLVSVALCFKWPFMWVTLTVSILYAV